MPYITAGDPPAPSLSELIVGMAEAGADIIEVGFPFSDPIADGPVIASAMYRALEAGMTPAGVFAQVKKARASTDVALVGMVSDSIVAHLDRSKFVAQAADAGFDGLIVPDADTEDLGDLLFLVGIDVGAVAWVVDGTGRDACLVDGSGKAEHVKREDL